MAVLTCRACGNKHKRWWPSCRNCFEKLPLPIPEAVDVKPFVKAIFGKEFEVSREAVQEVVASLRYRRQVVVVWYYGLDGGERLVDQRIGADFLEISRGTVNEHRRKALVDLRHPTRAKKLWDARIE